MQGQRRERATEKREVTNRKPREKQGEKELARRQYKKKEKK